MVKKNKTVASFSKPIRWFWITFMSLILSGITIFLLASVGLFGEMPDHTALENPRTNIASEIISSDGQTLGKFYFEDNRTPITFNKLPKKLVQALIATEDVRYYDHAGIDLRGTLRAFVFLGKKGGASTISQQLARQLFVGIRSKNKLETVIQKVKEWVIAIRLERQYTKEEIIAQYFNIYDFGNNADGIRSASRIYFGKEPKDLSINESAMLVGMFKNSSLYNPRPKRNPEGTKNRRNVVLAQMAKYGYIEENLKDSLQKQPLALNYSPESHREGIATYFRSYLRSYMKEWVNSPENRKPNGDKYNIYKDGLKIYTTIDSRMQAFAETAVSNHMANLQAEFFIQNTPKRNPTTPFLSLKPKKVISLLNWSMRRSERWRRMKYDLKKEDNEIIASFNKPTHMKIFSWTAKNNEIDTLMTPWDSMRYYKSFLRTGMMSMEPQTGHIKAWVGGINFKHFQYDMAKQGKRQVGSTFKPFVYAAAIDQLHLSPCDSFPKSQITIEALKYGNAKPWSPKNAGNNYGGFETLKSALANSRNTITARLMNEIGPQPVIDLARNLGVNQKIPVLPSIALGTTDISVYEMVAAYSTFANKGIYTKPVTVTQIEDKNGTILFQNSPQTKDVLSQEVAYVTLKLMEGVTMFGSGARLRHTKAKDQPVFKEIITGYPYEFKNPIAGKTGTTQNQSDGWFMGVVPNLVTGVWVGGEDRSIHFRTTRYGQGASMALPIWANYMRSCYEFEDLNISKDKFIAPKGLSIGVNCSSKSKDGKIRYQNSTINVPEIDF
ncbi:MAG: transglycosylase domain-containing protein [Algibacter sp.]|uniref:penicillin-binding protein 1A n=1 Tax=Algibacter sp. TaxID=1872428 RepID=UPI00260FDFFE|nr:transglycosylase domain-containing protein [Algibacter sp.]MDG1315328.1 transglycosylase domain-containing protein [Flavobacteriaceae bacterium]MDG1728904.1 transglycosylase domain-containing protein [Algibacter sp.]